MFDGEHISSRHDDGLFIMAEVVGLHCRHGCLGILRPHPHAVRMLLGKILDRAGGPPVRITFAQYRVHG